MEWHGSEGYLPAKAELFEWKLSAPFRAPDERLSFRASTG
jgi:hypothetical protein